MNQRLAFQISEAYVVYHDELAVWWPDQEFHLIQPTPVR